MYHKVVSLLFLSSSTPFISALINMPEDISFLCLPFQKRSSRSFLLPVHVWPRNIFKKWQMVSTFRRVASSKKFQGKGGDEAFSKTSLTPVLPLPRSHLPNHHSHTHSHTRPHLTLRALVGTHITGRTLSFKLSQFIDVISTSLYRDQIMQI